MEPLTQAQARQYSPMALAFLGDSVYEVMVREYLLRQANQPGGKTPRPKGTAGVCCVSGGGGRATAAPPDRRTKPVSINAAEMPITLFPAILLHRIIIGRPDWRACSVICT